MAALVTIHHEGAGKPGDTTRYGEGGYTCGIGVTQWYRFRSVASSFGTLHFNHVSLDICLSGNRMEYPITDNDIVLIHAAFMDCHARGEITDNPQVQAHKDNNGLYTYHGNKFSTVCPGDLTMLRWHDIVGACRLPSVPPPLSPAARARLIALDAWRHKIHRTALHYGDQSLEVAHLVGYLREAHFLGKNVTGDKYGPTLQRGILKFKDTVPELRDQPPPIKGKVFGGDAADALVALG